MSNPTAVSISLASLTNATVTFSDGSTHTFGPNPVLDLAAGVQATVPIQMLHDALVAREAGLQSQITSQTAAASAATAAFNTLQGQVDTLVDASIAAGDDLVALKSIRDTQAAPLSSASRKAKAQAAVDKAAADLAAAQATLAAHT